MESLESVIKTRHTARVAMKTNGNSYLEMTHVSRLLKESIKSSKSLETSRQSKSFKIRDSMKYPRILNKKTSVPNPNIQQPLFIEKGTPRNSIPFLKEFSIINV